MPMTQIRTRRLISILLLLAVVLMCPVMQGGEGRALAADQAKVVFEAEKPDANGYFTMDMTIYNATFNAFQFVLYYDAGTVIPVDASGKATQNFSSFAEKIGKNNWMATIGTEIDAEEGLIDFTGYVTPGSSVAVDGKEQAGVAVVGSTGLEIFRFHFKKTGDAAAVIKIATKDGGTPYRDYLAEGGAVADAGNSQSAVFEIVMPAETGSGSTVQGGNSSGGSSGGTQGQTGNAATMTKDERVKNTIALQIGNYAAAVDGVLSKIDPDNKNVVPYIKNQRTYVPLRFISEKLKANVSWDGVNRVVTIVKDGKTVVVPIGADYYTIDGVRYAQDAPAEIKESRTFVPFRCVAEAFENDVYWDGTNQLVILAPKSSPWTGETAVEKELISDILFIMSPMVRDFQ